MILLQKVDHEPNKSKRVRNVYKITCAVCGRQFSTVGLSAHVKSAHSITSDDYIKKFGDFRVNTRKANAHKDGQQLYECQLCKDGIMRTMRDLTYHLRITHNTAQDEYILNTLLQGAHPTCACGCGKKTKINSYSPPHATKFISGHNKSTLGYVFPPEAKEKMHDAAMRRIKCAKIENKTLPMHTRNAVFFRAYGSAENYSRLLETKNIRLISTHEEIFTLPARPIKFLCLVTNKEFECKSFEAVSPYVVHTRGAEQREVADFVRSIYSGNVVVNTQTVLPTKKEIDIYLPDIKVGIEYHGNYYHSEVSGKKSDVYHLQKTLSAESIGIHLIQIFSDEWASQNRIIKEKIKAVIGVRPAHSIYARKCQVKEIQPKEKNAFLEENHIQGRDAANVKLGLFYLNELVAVMTFSKPNIAKGGGENFMELSRYCTKIGYSVIGGAGKLLTHFKRITDTPEIITYADRRWTKSSRNLYTEIGFTPDGETKPNYYYTYNYLSRIHRFNFTKAKLVSGGADPTKSEWQIMQDAGYDRIWDCGHLKYRMSLKNAK